MTSRRGHRNRADHAVEAGNTRRPKPILAVVIAASTAALPLLFSAHAYDSFRLPKELLYRLEAIVVVAIILTTLVIRGRSAWAHIEVRRGLALLVGASCAWVIVTTTFSTNRLCTAAALAYSATALSIFVATYTAIRGRSLEWILVPLAIGAIPNAVVAILQATSIWNPFPVDATLSAHQRTTGLLGNPNDVGAYLALVSVCMAAAALTSRRAIWWAMLALVSAGVIASLTITAIVALLGGLAALAWIWSRRAVLIGSAAALVVALLLVAFSAPVRQRISFMRESLSARDYAALSSYRLYGLGPAWLMFRERPLTGVGPGAFKFNYLAYKKAFDERYPKWYLHGGGAVNFGEVHCDHLQILAEEGLPGYTIFLAALALLSSVTFRGVGGSPAATFAKTAAFPFAVCFGLLALAGFPLELSVTTQAAFHVAAGIAAWSDA